MSRILVTGGTGLVGQHLKELLPDATYLSSTDCNLTNEDEVLSLMTNTKFDIVIHLAAKVGGIMDNIKHPDDYITENLQINTNILKWSRITGVKRFIGMLSTCIYPDKVDKYPMTEEDLFLGPPQSTNFGYAYAKRCLAIQIDACNTQYGTKYNYLTPCNLYGDYSKRLIGDKNHFITALLSKIRHNEDGFLRLIGTGKPLRQFMHAQDLAKIIVKVIDEEVYESFNVAPTFNYSIDEMARIALEITNKDLKIIYSRPHVDGQYRKDVSNKKLLKIFPDFKFTNLNEGLKQAYDKIS